MINLALAEKEIGIGRERPRLFAGDRLELIRITSALVHVGHENVVAVAHCLDRLCGNIPEIFLQLQTGIVQAV